MHDFPVVVISFAIPVATAFAKGAAAVGAAALGWKISKHSKKQKRENIYQQMESKAGGSHHSTKAHTKPKPQTIQKTAPLSIDPKKVKHIETARSLKRKNTESVEQAKQHGRDKQRNQVQNENQTQPVQPPVKPPKDPKDDDKNRDIINEKINDILKDAKPGRETSGKAKQFEKIGDFNDALQDFEK